MLGLFGKRGVEVVVLFFAGYAFVFVPLGKRTGYEHAKAILGTPAAKDAGNELLDAADRLRHRVFSSGAAATAPSPSVPRHARPGAPDFGRRDVPQVLPAPLEGAENRPDASL